jgi:integrase
MDINFKKLSNKTIYDFFNRNEIKNLSEITKQNIFVALSSIINYGIKNKYRKPFVIEKLKFKPKNNIICFTKDEETILVNYLLKKIDIRKFCILFGLCTGLRIGELCALKWKDIDFINNTLSVNRTVQRIKNIDGNTKTKIIIGNPKTINSNRIIPLPEILINYLNIFKTNNDYYIFTNSNIPKDPRTIEKYFNCLLKRLNLKHLKFHTLRHTFATRLREQKVDIKTISELLGHSDWKITQSIYVHTSIEYKRTSVNNLSNFIIKGS